MRRKGSLLRELPILVVVALVVSLLIKTFLVQFFYIPSGSMENTLQIKDRVAVTKSHSFHAISPVEMSLFSAILLAGYLKLQIIQQTNMLPS